MATQVKMPPIATQYFPFNGGLDLVTPPIERFNGSLRFGVNVEIGVRGGYATAAGYERYDGQFKPSNAVYSILTVTLTGTVNVGDVVNNLAVTVSGTVIAVGTGYLVLTKTVGQFSTGNLYVGARWLAPIPARSRRTRRLPPRCMRLTPRWQLMSTAR